VDNIEEKIKSRIQSLELIVPNEGGRVVFDMYGGGPEECRITANKIGYLKLGLKFINAAYLPAEPIEEKDGEDIDVDIKDITDPKSTIYFDWFKRKETWEEKEKDSKSPWQLKLIGIGFALFVIVTGVLAIIGLVTIIKFAVY
jgi:hypothetical protein